MAAALWGVKGLFDGWFDGSTIQKLIALTALIGTGGLVYLGLAWVIGAVDRDEILLLLRRKKVS